jgi:hypothetical protein
VKLPVGFHRLSSFLSGGTAKAERQNQRHDYWQPWNFSKSSHALPPYGLMVYFSLNS